MEECGVPADAGLIERCAGIDVRSTLEEQSGRFDVAVLRGDMQKRSSRERELAPAGHAAIEFGETLVHKRGIRVNQRSQTIEPAAEQLQHGRRIVLGPATSFEEDVEAGAQSLAITRVRRDRVVES